MSKEFQKMTKTFKKSFQQILKFSNFEIWHPEKLATDLEIKRKKFLDRIEFRRDILNEENLIFSFILTTGWDESVDTIISGEWIMNLNGIKPNNWTGVNRYLKIRVSDL